MNASKPTTVEIRLPSRLGYEKVAMSTAAAVATLMGFRQDRVEDLKTAVAEACINAIEHGNRMKESRSVGVVLSSDEDSLEVKVIDDGKGLKGQLARQSSGVHQGLGHHSRCAMKSRLGRPDIARKMRGEEDPRGMGMFLIQALVDEAEWVTGQNGKSSYVRLVIRLGKDALAPCVNEVCGRNAGEALQALAMARLTGSKENREKAEITDRAERNQVAH
jgi:serine/threonine-protein kinase RsbW